VLRRLRHESSMAMNSTRAYSSQGSNVIFTFLKVHRRLPRLNHFDFTQPVNVRRAIRVVIDKRIVATAGPLRTALARVLPMEVPVRY